MVADARPRDRPRVWDADGVSSQRTSSLVRCSWKASSGRWWMRRRTAHAAVSPARRRRKGGRARPPGRRRRGGRGGVGGGKEPWLEENRWSGVDPFVFPGR
ncbi:hypothetical protein ZWY2020_029473 [Hordeum vulgare]|nr:hypothetical protein ZWY2020_029473 [Hordeum vulgare]